MSYTVDANDIKSLLKILLSRAMRIRLKPCPCQLYHDLAVKGPTMIQYPRGPLLLSIVKYSIYEKL